jgi:hypothetical protein
VDARDGVLSDQLHNDRPIVPLCITASSLIHLITVYHARVFYFQSPYLRCPNNLTTAPQGRKANVHQPQDARFQPIPISTAWSLVVVYRAETGYRSEQN